MSGFDEKKTNNTPEMTPFMVQAEKDLKALRENHQRRRFFKDTVQGLITALEEAIAEAQSDGFDNLLYLHYRTMRTGLQGRSSVDGAWAIYDARLETIHQGALDLKRRPKTTELQQENETLKAPNIELRALLKQNEVQHQEAIALLKKQHEEALEALKKQTSEDVCKRVDARVAEILKGTEKQANEVARAKKDIVAGLQETIKEQEATIALLKAGKKAESEENHDKRQGQSSPRFHQPTGC
jgi:hypothetical protein